MTDPDSAFVQRALHGDAPAFGLLVERHRPVVLRLCAHMLGDPADAEDAAQEACLQAFLGLGRLRDPARFGAWLYGIALNLCRMRLRARREIRPIEDWDGGRLAPGFAWAEAEPSPEAAVEVRELHEAVLAAIALLPADYQAVVRLHYLDGLTLAEIGLLAGAPLGTVKARLHRARERLRAELARRLGGNGGPSHRKETLKMIEVNVHDVVMRASPPQDVLESASREEPAPQAEPVRRPLPGHLASHRVVLLKERSGERVLPIWIGPVEGDWLALQLAEKSAPRPLTYELMARVMDAAQLSLEKVAVTRLKDEVFYATLWLRDAGGKQQEIDARPSDALNLALRLNAPIFVDAAVLEAQAVAPDEFAARASGDQAGEAGWTSVPAPDLTRPPAK